MDNLDILIVPLANPDGRAYSQSKKDDAARMHWRKNRAPIQGGPPKAVGVDINRNFDIAWDCDVYYNAAAVSYFELGRTKNPADPLQTFHGNAKKPPDNHHPQLELESQNLLSVVETRRVTFFVDLHSANLTIMYPWAIEANGRNPDQTFLKAGFTVPGMAQRTEGPVG